MKIYQTRLHTKKKHIQTYSKRVKANTSLIIIITTKAKKIKHTTCTIIMQCASNGKIIINCSYHTHVHINESIKYKVTIYGKLTTYVQSKYQLTLRVIERNRVFSVVQIDINAIRCLRQSVLVFRGDARGDRVPQLIGWIFKRTPTSFFKKNAYDDTYISQCLFTNFLFKTAQFTFFVKMLNPLLIDYTKHI